MFSQFETKDMGKREVLWMRFSETETKDRYRRGEICYHKMKARIYVKEGNYIKLWHRTYAHDCVVPAGNTISRAVPLSKKKSESFSNLFKRNKYFQVFVGMSFLIHLTAQQNKLNMWY